MAKKKQNTKRLTEAQFVRLISQMTHEHGRVRVTVRDAHFQDPCSCLCKSCAIQFNEDNDQRPSFRRRIFTKDGDVHMSMKGYEYSKWTRYSRSCFVEHGSGYDNDYADGGWCDRCQHRDCEYDSHYKTKPERRSPKRSVQMMLDHDRNEWTPIEIEWGFRFKKRLKIKITG